MEEYSVIGKRVPRIDAKEKVMGQAKYAADYSLPGHALVQGGEGSLRPRPHPQHRYEPRRKAPRRERGGDRQGFRRLDMGLHGDHEGRAAPRGRQGALPYEGVAAVAAIDEETAEEACELIKVDYEELPGVFDPEEAMREGAPVIHDYRPNNVSVEYHWSFGDVEKAFAESYMVREDRFETGKVVTGFLEPPASLAYYDPSGSITVWPAKQSPYFHYRHLAACFRLPLSKIRIIQPFIGGGFGGTKNDSVAGDFCTVMLSKKTGKPVKYVYPMEEVLTTCRRRHNMIIYNKMGMTKDGLLTAVESRVVGNGGGYTAIGPLTMYLTGCATTMPYKLPNYKYDAWRVFTNNPVSAAMRGHGFTHTRFACDIQMGMLAEELGIDPVEIKMRNAIDNPKRGEEYRTINGISFKTCGLKEAMKSVAEEHLWADKEKMEKRRDRSRTGSAYRAPPTREAPGSSVTSRARPS